MNNQQTLKWVFGGLLSALVLCFFLGLPFLIHFGLDYFDPHLLMGFLFAFLIARIVLMKSANKWLRGSMLLVISVYCVWVISVDDAQLLRYYPVLMSLYFSALFFSSLWEEQTLVEGFAKLSGKKYPDGARVYMRSLTRYWALLLMVNACVAAYSTCCMSDAFWLLYNGVLSYVLMGLFFVSELVFRQYYHRKHFPDWR